MGLKGSIGTLYCFNLHRSLEALIPNHQPIRWPKTGSNKAQITANKLRDFLDFPAFFYIYIFGVFMRSNRARDARRTQATKTLVNRIVLKTTSHKNTKRFPIANPEKNGKNACFTFFAIWSHFNSKLIEKICLKAPSYYSAPF